MVHEPPSLARPPPAHDPAAPPAPPPAPPTRRRQTLTIDLGPLKAPWLAWCTAQGATPSQALKQVIQRLTTQGAGNTTPTRAPATELRGTPDPRRVRREISLTASENTLAQQAASAAGYTFPKWIV